MPTIESPAAPIRELLLERIDTPIGVLCVFTDETHLRGVAFARRETETIDQLRRRAGFVPIRDAAATHPVAERLRRYFAGDLTAIDGIRVAAVGSPFELSVWRALCDIPIGTVTTYGALAVALGHPVSASRAVGLANGANPIPIVVPCHRVIGANGNLTGYGGGMERKRWLLRHEGVLLVS